MFTNTSTPVTLQAATAEINAMASDEFMKLVTAGHAVSAADLDAIRAMLEQQEKSIVVRANRAALDETAMQQKAQEELDEADPGFSLRELFLHITKGE